MDIKVSLLMNVALIVAYCQLTISQRTDATDEQQLLVDVKLEMESMRQLLIDLKQAAVRNESQAMQLKSEIDEIRQIVIQQQYWFRNEQRKTECPPGFDYLPEAGSCFTLVVEKMNWETATERCRGIMPGVHLAAITRQAESDAITRYLQSQFRKYNFASPEDLVKDPHIFAVWISGYRKNPVRCDDPFVWKPLNGIEIPFSYTNWAHNEPNCEGEEPCVHIVPGMDFAWNDSRCSRLNFPICEI